jgi:nucleoside-diphosphate-sugar epimerase
VSRFAVTGATGFIGRHVCARLSARGDEVRAIVRPESKGEPPPGAQIVRAPLSASALRDSFAGVDTVVHLAGVVSSTRDEDYVATNARATREVAQAAQEAGARLVYVSSLAAAGPAPIASPRSEDDPPAPINMYGRTKLEGERAVRAIPDLRWVILRPGTVYGPGDRAVLPLFQAAKRGVLPLVGRLDAGYCFVHVDDVARAVEAATASTISGETVFVGHPETATAREVLEAIRAAVGAGVIVRVPTTVLRIAAMGGDIVAAITGREPLISRRRYDELMAGGFACRVDRLRDRLGVIAAIDLREGMSGTAEWYRSAGWL